MFTGFTVHAQPRKKPAAVAVPAPSPTPARGNNLDTLADGGYISDWLVSTPFPATVDAGLWENFNRFNIESLPQRDWLAPFGGIAAVKPQPGAAQPLLPNYNNAPAPNSPGAANRPRADLPETGATTGQPDNIAAANTLAWTPFQASGALITISELLSAKEPGTAYIASYLRGADNQTWFVETDGFLGEIWLNGEKIYDGFALEAARVVLARFKPGQNTLILRADGIRGDPWRKNWGWAASARLWRARPVGPGLLVGALRSGGGWGASDNAVREAARFVCANLSREIIGGVVGAFKTEAGSQELTLQHLAPGEVRDVELLPPVGVSPPGGRRRVSATVAWGAYRAEWESVWEANPPPNNGTIYYLEGFHVDPVYLHDQRDYAKITLSNTNQYLESLKADPAYGVFLSEIDYLKPYLDTHPEHIPLLREAIRQGRVGTGGTYNQFNELNIGGEAIVRNILYGRGYHEGILGDKPRALPLWDVFGHAPQLTQIAQKSGFDGVVWSKKISGFPSFFYDYALDGSRLLHRRLDYAYSFSGFGSGKNYSFDAFRRMTERKFAEPVSLGSEVDLRINAADFTPPWTNLAGRGERLKLNRPQIIVTGQAQTRYFDHLRREIAEGKVQPTVSSRDKLFFHMGVGMARSDLKVAQRKTENAVLTAERFATLAYLRGAKYPDLALDKAWRQILFNSHHDAITGTPSDNAFLDLAHGYREAFELSQGALNDSLRFLAAQIKTTSATIQEQPAGSAALLVFNPVAWQRTDVARGNVSFPSPVEGYEIRTANGEIVPSQIVSETRNENRQIVRAEFTFVARDVPSLGYRVFFAQPVSTLNLTRLSQNTTIENEYYRLTVDPARGGAVLSLYDKNAKREIIRQRSAQLGNEIAVLDEELTRKNVIYPAWELWTTGKRRFSTSRPAQVTHEAGGGTQRLVIAGELPKGPKYRQIIELHEGVRRIDFRTELTDYRGRDELFAVNFPLNLANGALVTEDRFGAVVRNSSKGFLDFRSNTDKLAGGGIVYPVYNWAEYGAALSLRFTGAQGQTIANIPFKPLAIVTGRQGGAAEMTEKLVAELIKQGISATPFYDDYDAKRRNALAIEDNTLPRSLKEDAGYHSFRISLGNATENSYTAKLLQANSSARAGFESRLNRDKFAYLFIYDRDVPEGWPPMPVLLIAGKDESQQKRAVEQLLSPLSQKGARLIALPAETIADQQFTISNSATTDYGVALINGGTPATSLERPDTLTLLLTHTALWPGMNLGWEFTPEHKSHVFTYALYPHTGDWRSAGTVKSGYEFNNPLIARQTDIHDGVLPREHSFLSVDSDNVILSALKLGGNPQADFQTVSAEREIVARFYESEGLPTRATVDFGVNIAKATLTDLLERPLNPLNPLGRNLEVDFKGFGINTYSISPGAPVARAQQLGAVAEIVQPVFSRYWAHNAGAAPIGNDPVKVTLRPVEQMGALDNFGYDDGYNQGGTTTVPLKVSINNSYQSQAISGTVFFEVAPGWRAVPDSFTFELAANSSLTKDLVVVGFPVKKGESWARASGLVKAYLQHGGQTYFDTLETGKPQRLEWRLESQAGQLFARIRNPNRQRIEGAVSFITPPEFWANLNNAVQPPRERGFSLNPLEDVVIPLTRVDQLNGAWAVGRLAYNGHVEYLRADGRPVEPLKK